MKRVVLGILLNTFIGILITVLVSWFCAGWTRSITHTQPPELHLINEIEHGVNNISTSEAIGYYAEHRTGARGAEGGFLYWTSYFSTRSYSGWPFYALQSRVKPFHAAESSKALQAWELPIEEHIKRGFPTNRLPSWCFAFGSRRLPLVPMWPGFLINTLFWGTLSWVLASAAKLIRRRSRIRKGLCVRCRYALGSLKTCPECGTPAVARTMTG